LDKTEKTESAHYYYLPSKEKVYESIYIFKQGWLYHIGELGGRLGRQKGENNQGRFFLIKKLISKILKINFVFQKKFEFSL